MVFICAATVNLYDDLLYHQSNCGIVCRLKSGRSLSCGCRRSDHQIKEQKHGLSVSYAGFGRRKNKNSRTGITGVSAWGDKYRAYITVDRKQINLGTFGKLEDAVKARRNAEEQYFSERQKRVDKIKRAVMQKER